MSNPIWQIRGRMSYWTTLTLVDLGFRKTDWKAVRTDLTTARRHRNPDLCIFLSNVGLGPGGGLEFLVEGKPEDPTVYPFDIDELGFTPAMQGRWSGDDRIARWCASHRAEGRIAYHSLEVDAGAWMYELDGRGRFRCLELQPAGDWITVPHGATKR